jgi:hypothetical protein
MATPDDLLARAVRLHDPAGGLDAVRELREHLARLEAIHVENALREGWRWADIAAGLGLSKQAAHRKYAETMRPRLERDAGAARLALLYARQEAQALGAGAIGTEHVLLGLSRLAGTSVASTLAALGADGDRLRVAAGEAEPEEGGPLTVPCRLALGEALRAAPALEPERVLLAILDRPGCGALRVLERLGVEPAALRERVAPALA